MKIEQSIFPINARQMRHYHEKLNFLSEGVRCGLDKEIAPDGTY